MHITLKGKTSDSYEQTAGPSTAPLAIKLRVTPLRWDESEDTAGVKYGAKYVLPEAAEGRAIGGVSDRI
jgi:hypothetical protein